MSKKIVGLVFILILLTVGGVFLWQKNQKDVAELNKNLPEGVRVVKSLVREEYRVVNQIDGYEFKTPVGWRGLNKITYTPERVEGRYSGSSVGVEGREGAGRIVGIDRFEAEESINLKNWAEKFFEEFGFVGEFILEKIDVVDVVKTRETIHLGGEYVYFFKQDYAVYAITGGSEESIREIIISGKW